MMSAQVLFGSVADQRSGTNFVPYELRPPTLERVHETYWAPADEHVLKPPVWGVGWALNVGRVVEMIRGERGATASIPA